MWAGNIKDGRFFFRNPKKKMQKTLDSISLFMAVLINENGGGIFGRHGKRVQSVQVHEANNSEEPGAVIPHRDVGIIFFRMIYYHSTIKFLKLDQTNLYFQRLKILIKFHFCQF